MPSPPLDHTSLAEGSLTGSLVSKSMVSSYFSLHEFPIATFLVITLN